MNLDEGHFLPEHHLAERIFELISSEMYHGLSAMTVQGVLFGIAVDIGVDGNLENRRRDEEEDGENWKDPQ